jgi:hypothetical protein
MLTTAIAACILAGCGQEAADTSARKVQDDSPALQEKPVGSVVPARPPVLTRSDLVAAAREAASAYSAGDVSRKKDPLVGRSFSVRLPFGCGGAGTAQEGSAEESGLAAADWTVDRKAIQLRMMPGDWAGSTLLAKAGTSAKWEAVEGFWIPYPWLGSETCPAVQTDPLQTGSSPASPQTLGIAAVFEAGGSRLGRRNGRAYEYTVHATDEAPLTWPKAGFRMVLEGRVTAFPNDKAIACRAAGPDQRPVCIVAAHLDRVAFEDSDGSTLGEWRPG